MAMAPVLLPNTVCDLSNDLAVILLLFVGRYTRRTRSFLPSARSTRVRGILIQAFYLLAEFRGPGVHHNFDDSGSGYDNDNESKGKSFGIGGYKGRIIFLGDGTEVLTDSDDTEMFDNSEEDKDLASQVEKGSSASSGSEDHEVIGSPVTPEKLDTKMNVDQKLRGSESASDSKEATKSEDKKDA